jgi:hypothetical protein
MPLPHMSTAGISTGKYLPWLKYSVRLVKYSLRQNISLLILEHEEHSRSSEEHNEVDRPSCANFLGPLVT